MIRPREAMMRRRRFGTILAVLAPVTVLGAWTDSGVARGQPAGAAAESASGVGVLTHARDSRAEHLDRHFVNAMVPHHQGAIEMARAELDKGKDPKVKEMAQRVVDEQTREIQEMSDLSARRWGSRPRGRRSGPMGYLMDVRISMDMSMGGEMVAKAPDVDRMFLEMMVAHHSAAIVMADEERRNGADPQLKTMAAKMLAAQAREIGEIRQMLGG